jgi:adenylate kinase
MNLALLGPSGVGKGTHAVELATRYQLRHLATGDLLRQNLQARNALGLLARRYMEHGDLVPDEVIDAMIEEWVDRLPAAQGALFDGFPRTADQVRFLDELLLRLDRRLDAAIYLRLDDDAIVERLTGRQICRSCQTPYHDRARPPRLAGWCDHCGGELYRRPDDNVELTRTRLRVFHRTTEPILSHYAELGKLVIVSGAGSVAEVARRLDEAVRAIAGGTMRYATPAELAGVLPDVAPAMAPRKPARPSLDFVLLGGPGSGKGTQAEVLCAQLHLPHIATGDLFRSHLRQATKLGQLAKTYMDRGELVPDDVTDAMVAERLALPDAAEGFILDGFPRTLPQAEALREIMGHLHRHLTGVLYINVSDEAIVGRLSGRLICRECQAPYHTQFKPAKTPGRCDSCGGELYQRADDNPATVRARLATFHRQTEPLIAFYRRQGLLHEISGEGKVVEITAQGLATIQRLAGNAEIMTVASTR